MMGEVWRKERNCSSIDQFFKQSGMFYKDQMKSHDPEPIEHEFPLLKQARTEDTTVTPGKSPQEMKHSVWCDVCGFQV